MVVPTGPALQYLEDAQRVDADLSRIGAQVALTGQDMGTADSTQIHGIREVARLYLESVGALEQQKWPPSARPDVHRFVTTQKALSQALRDWANGREHSLLQLDTILEKSQGPAAINNLRRVLGLPYI
jgi:hypothetical protein